MTDFLDILIGGLLMGGIYALISMGLSLQYGVARVFNVAHGEFIMVAAFITGILYTEANIHPLISLVIVGPITFIIGYVLHRTISAHLRTNVPSFGQVIILGLLIAWVLYRVWEINIWISIVTCVPAAIIIDFVLSRYIYKRVKFMETPMGVFEGKSMLAFFGVFFIIQNLAKLEWGSATRDITVPGLATPVDIAGAVFQLNRLVTLGFALGIGIAFYLFLARTRIGKAIRAAAQDPVTAGLMGVNINQVLALCFGFGALLAGLAGVLWSMCFSVYATMGLEKTIIAIVIVVLGGLGSIPGSFIGGIILGVIGSIVNYYEPSLTLAAYYLIFIVLLMVRPKGIMGR